jgi:hypothetical protein
MPVVSAVTITVPACLEFFAFGSATPEDLRTAAQLQ